MQITLYRYNGIRNKINKSLLEPLVIQDVTIKNDYDVCDLTLVFSGNGNYDTFNYCFIPDLGRYYFIDSIRHLKGTFWEVEISVDVLKTYSSEILASRAIITRSENPSDNFVDALKSETFENEVIPLNDVFNHNGNLILITSIGGQ